MTQTKPVTHAPNCPECSSPLPTRIVTVSTMACWNCRNNVRVATGQKDGMSLAQDYFTQAETDFVKQKGVTLERRYSQTAKGSYIANICTSCNNLQGNFYLYTGQFKNLDPNQPTMRTQDTCDTCSLKPCPSHTEYNDYRGEEKGPTCLFEEGSPVCTAYPETRCTAAGFCEGELCARANPFDPMPERE